MEATDVNARWQADMAPFFELDADAAADGLPAGFTRLQEVFHLA